MQLSYKQVESTIKPLALEVTVDTVYLRKDITSVTTTPKPGITFEYWVYQEAVLTIQEFNEYSKLVMVENAIKGKDDSVHITHIMEGQKAGESNILSIMEAVADLYEIVGTLKSV